MRSITTNYTCFNKRVFFFSAFCFFSFFSHAQHSVIKRSIEKDMEKKYAEPRQTQGKGALEGITYENDTRYKDPYNKVQATISFENITFGKNGKVKSSTTDKVVFGRVGECMVMQEGTSGETRMLFHYGDKANYMVSVKDKTAIKMPLINMKKMIEKSARKVMEETQGNSSWEATDEYETIGGFKCRKYVYTYRDNRRYTKMDAWLSSEVKLDLSDNYLLGSRLKEYQFPENPEYKEMSNGFMVRTLLYDKKGEAVHQRDLKEFKKSADEKYFDLDGYAINDILQGL